MPQGKGTYGRQKGRPKESNNLSMRSMPMKVMENTGKMKIMPGMKKMMKQKKMM